MLPFLLIALVLSFTFSFIFGTVFFQDDGIFVKTKKGKIRRSIMWKDVKKAVVSEDQQNGSGRFICITENSSLSPIHTHMPGIISAMYYDKHTISLPCDEALFILCKSKLAENNILIQFTGLGRLDNSAEMIEVRIKKEKVYKRILIIQIILVILFSCFVFWKMYF